MKDNSRNFNRNQKGNRGFKDNRRNNSNDYSRKPKNFIDIEESSSEDSNSPAPTTDRLEGRNSVMEALRAGREINKLWILEPSDGQKMDARLAKILDEAIKRKIVIIRATRQNLDQMSQTHNHQGVIAAVASHEYVEIEDILEQAANKGHAPLIAVLDELKDAYNLGSILRIADAAGVDGIIIPKHRSIGLDSVVAKASAGAIEYVPVARVTNIAQTLRELKEKHNFWVCGTAMEGSVPYDKADYSGSLAIIIGSEGEGMRDIVRKECDFLISIPMAGQVNSLNAACAAAVVIFEAQKNRIKKD